MPAFDLENLTRLQAQVPGWRASQMPAAFEVFDALEEPAGFEEDWKYVDYNLPFSQLAPVEQPGQTLEPGPFLSSVGDSAGRVVVVDGQVVDVVSDVDVITTLADVGGEPSFSIVPVDHNKLAAAHSAFATDGVFIEVAAGQVVDSPIVVDVQSVTAGSASFPHVSVKVGENAEVELLVLYRSLPGARLLMVPSIGLEVEDGGRLRFLSVQSLDHAADAVVHQRLTLGRDASARLGEVGLGANLGRLDLGVNLVGDGSSSEMVGLYFGEQEQTLDYRMVINHSGRSTSSDVFLKGAVEDYAQSVFTGILRIEKDAQRTSTFETNRNLVLSEHAKAQSVPNLEILCDDVVCGHASSVGPLDEELLYYLRSRGLSKERAERLLIRGFFQEVIDRLPIEGLEEPIAEEVFSRFVHAQAEGRVA